MARIKIIGTSHISPESIKKVENVILKEKPDIVAVELDRKRLFALLQKGKRQKLRFRDIKRVGFKGWMFAQIGAWAERKLGAKVGVSPGAEMLKAIAAAQQIGAKIALIDQDIEITLRKFSKSLSWKEKWTFVKDVFKGVVLRKGVKIDLSKVPSQKVIKKLIADVKKRYPNVHRVLIEERNELMAQRLARIMKDMPEAKVVAVIGAGHEKEISKLLKKYLKAKSAK